MELLKNMGQALKFKERYDDMDRYGMEEYDKEDCKQLRELEKSGAPLSESQKNTLKYCDTIKGERTRAITEGGLAAGKVVGGVLTGNLRLAGQGVGDFGKYMAGEAQEVAEGNDPEGQELQKGDIAKSVVNSASGLLTSLGGGGGANPLGGGGGNIQDVVSSAAGNIPVGGSGVPGMGGDANAMMQQMMSNPQMMQMMMQMMQQQGAQNAFQTGGTQGTLNFLANQNAKGSKLKRSTRQHSYIKGNTRGLV